MGSVAETTLAFAHPAVREWFTQTFAEPTAAQEQAWPRIAAGESVLLLAPTGSGKTLAAFLVALDRVLCDPKPTGKTRVVYLSPLKALGVDVERNLQQPLLGIQATAERLGTALAPLRVGVRSGDTPAHARTRLAKQPPDILITTPESLYLMLTSAARSTLSEVETIIVDEIHALSGTKRGAHLFTSLERLEALRSEPRPLQRIGLSATQRPLDEIARLLGGFETKDGSLRPRAVSIVSVTTPKRLTLNIEVPGADMTDLGGPKGREGTAATSLWPALNARVLELILAHQTTMVFVNSRRSAERLASMLNELAGSELVLAHHGSLAKELRADAEQRLKQGTLRAIVATSSLELGIDMGAVDLVIQVEAPSSIASGVQRVGRAGHHVGGVSRGVFFPKFRGDLLASAAALEQILRGAVEETHYPRNPLDVLAQHIVAHVVAGPIAVDELYQMLCRAAPFAELARPVFEGVLDMLAGRYPSERFRELRARLIWDRSVGTVRPRRGARLLAVTNGGTIVDRGLFAVYLTGSEPPVRVGELDEEMVFESRPGEVFLLGSSSWRIDEVAADRVWVSPAPGEPGQMPFWRGERPGRSANLGSVIGRLARTISESSDESAVALLQRDHAMDRNGANHLVAYLREQARNSLVPTDQRIVLECFPDEIGDWRVALLSPYGGRVHAAWTIAVTRTLRQELGLKVDSMWLDDGIVFRLPGTDDPPALSWFVPEPAKAEQLIRDELGSTALFSVHFRDNAARALLLPRRQLNRRTPLWVQARRARDLLAVAREFTDFPIVLETFRECLQEVFDLNAFLAILGAVQEGRVRAERVVTRAPSPFAAALLFSYTANFIYDNNAPPAEQRAQALRLDHRQLALLLGEPQLRELLDAQSIARVTAALQRLDGAFPLRDAEDVYDLLWDLGDLTEPAIEQRAFRSPGDVPHADAADRASANSARLRGWLAELEAQGRIAQLRFAAETRFVVAEDAARYRDALGAKLESSLPAALLQAVPEPLADVVLRFARTHGPFPLESLIARFFPQAPRDTPSLTQERLLATLSALEQRELLVRGAFLPEGSGEEWCHVDVLARLKSASLVKAREELLAVDVETFTRFLLEFHHIGASLSGLEGVLTVVEQLQGIELPLIDLETAIFPARVKAYRPSLLDELCIAGEIVWCAAGSPSEPKVRLFLTDQQPSLFQASAPCEGERAASIRELLARRGALFFNDIQNALGGFETDTFQALWQLVWASEVTNDTLAPLRSLFVREQPKQRFSAGLGYRSRRAARPGSEGRWSLVPQTQTPSGAERAKAVIATLLARHGIVTRESLNTEPWVGGFSAFYPLLKIMEDAGRVRRGYFVQGLSATQFARPGADSALRAAARANVTPAVIVCSSDPANPYGAILPWPEVESTRLARSAGSHVVLFAGQLLAYSSKQQRTWTVLLPAQEATEGTASAARDALLNALTEWQPRAPLRAALVQTINREPALTSPWRSIFEQAGFRAGAKGLLKRAQTSS